MSATNNPNHPGGTTGKTSDDIKSAVRGIKGLGDAIRGTAMEAVDSVGHSKEGAARHHAIAEKGAAEAKAADQRFGDRRAEKNENLGGVGGGSTTLPSAAHAHAHAGAGAGGGGIHAQPAGVHSTAATSGVTHRADETLVGGQGASGASATAAAGGTAPGSITNSKIARAGQ